MEPPTTRLSAIISKSDEYKPFLPAYRYLQYMFVLLLLSQLSAFNQTVYAGQMHYARIPRQYWEHRMQMVKGIGMNGLSVYIMWNYHEGRPGQWDFSTDNKNLTAFLQLAHQQDLKVFIRPGPYVCAEWDFGGLPTYLLKNHSLQIRANNDFFMAQTERYIKVLAPILRPFIHPAGPILALQIQNQYGEWGRDLQYIAHLRDLWKANLGDIEYYVVDHPQFLKLTVVDGLSIGINGFPTQQDYQNARDSFPTAPTIFGGEVYPGWFTHWRDKEFRKVTAEETVKMVEFFLKSNRSFSLYMAHGGTNFGFTAGGDEVQTYVTSYDYDAPINEQGAITPKYTALRALFTSYLPAPPPPPPQAIPISPLPKLNLSQHSTISSMGSYFNCPVTTIKNVTSGNWTLQDNGLSHGAIAYQFWVDSGKHSMVVNYADFLVVVVGMQKWNFTVFGGSYFANISFSCSDRCKVQMLVEALGHWNVRYDMDHNRHGLFSIESSFEIPAMSMKLLPLNPSDLNTQKSFIRPNLGSIFKQNFTIPESKRVQGWPYPGDSYLNMGGFQKGYVWINGRNLGRYWDIGPQRNLFVPGVWLKYGNNQIVVLDFIGEVAGSVAGVASLEDRIIDNK